MSKTNVSVIVVEGTSRELENPLRM